MNNRYLVNLKDQTVLVTGATGFIGHNLIKSLVNDYQCKVIAVDDCSNSTEETIKEVRDKVEFHQISVLDTDKLFPLIDRANYIFHLACIQIAASSSKPLLDMDVNARSTLQVLEYLRGKQMPHLKRFVYASSCSVYGSSSRLPIDENASTIVLSNYAATKLLGEHYTRIYNRNYDIPVTVVRYSNVYGYGQTPRNLYCGVLGKFVHNAIHGLPLTIFGDGEQTRDYTFISDAIEATILTAVHPLAYGDIFNIGTTVETSVNSLVKVISDLAGPNVVVQHQEERDIDNIRRTSIDIEKIHQRLGWTPRVNISKGIFETYNWYKSVIYSKD